MQGSLVTYVDELSKTSSEEMQSAKQAPIHLGSVWIDGI